jgi:hypothetical protein
MAMHDGGDFPGVFCCGPVGGIEDEEVGVYG